MKNSWNITLKGTVWRYAGPGGWHFLNASEEDSKKLKSEKRVNRTGYGYVPVTATLGETSWQTTLFPSKEGPYLLAIKSSVRARERVAEGDQVEVHCAIMLSDPKLDFDL